LEEVRATDSEENVKTTPPSGERIDLHAIWGVEVYTSSQVAALFRSFSKLGWDVDHPLRGYDNPTRWLQRYRESAHSGGSLNLGVIQRPGSKGYLRATPVPLPQSVEFAQTWMYSLTSSVTCIVAGFALDEKYSKRLDEAVRREYQTHAEELPGVMCLC